MNRTGQILATAIFLSTITAGVAFSADGDYQTYMGFSSRNIIWFVAQTHLYFGAFVLGVPIFAVIMEYAGYRRGVLQLDDLAYEFTGLLSVAFAFTSALGGLFLFALVYLYPTFFSYMQGAFTETMLLYALLFFGETFTLYIYYYGWRRFSSTTKWPTWSKYSGYAIGGVFAVTALLFFLGVIGDQPYLTGEVRAFVAALLLLAGGSFLLLTNNKGMHIWFGVWLNIFGTLIMMVANSWASYMMSPTGFNPDTGVFTGSVMEAFFNPLLVPLGVHRILGNIAFGGFLAGAYAAVRFIGAETDKERAHYDWMGYTANLVGVAGLIPLPFAGYYLGREVYSHSAVMGANMMGGDFSFTFILQALLVGSIFLIACYYLWTGMTRIPGAERYRGWVKYLNSFILIGFAIWVTPHNMPLGGAEVSAMGGSQYHPTLKYLGLMPAKNAVVNLIIISTFISFLLYRRANMKGVSSIVKQGATARFGILLATLFSFLIVGQYAIYLLALDPQELNLTSGKVTYILPVAWLLLATCVMFAVTAYLSLIDKGNLGQYLLMGWIIISVVVFPGYFGFIVMEKANPFLRNIAVAQFLQLIGAIILVSVIDLFLYAKSESTGSIRWGRIPLRSQYALLTLCILVTLTMGLMGYVRSGLRTDWHIYGVMRDISVDSATPTNFDMTLMVSVTTLVFLFAIAIIFWLSSIAKKG